MENEKLQCPACRAKQTWRDECRRCHADLRLLVRALERVKTVEEQLRFASQLDDEQRRRLVQEYALLRPAS